MKVSPVLVSVLLLASFSNALAQGSIFGTVQNSDLSNPLSEDLAWFGFLDNTDEEIRTEMNIGAGYDGANWFDDFQNYTTEAAGNPYDFYFTNHSLGELNHLEGPIPDNSFQQENVLLSAGAVPDRPAGLIARVLDPNHIEVSWEQVAGLTYHIYRRETSNNGLFRRIDDPTGNLTNRGVDAASFVDSSTGGSTDFAYLLIAEDDAGNLSSHSDEAVADASCICPQRADVAPQNTEGDGTVNILDVVAMIDFVFRFGDPLPEDSTCPRARADVSPVEQCGDGVINVLDIVYVIDFVFRFGPAICDPCQ